MKQGYRKSEKLATLSPEQLEELLAQAETEHPLDLLARVGAQALLQAALEAEIEEALGRTPIMVGEVTGSRDTATGVGSAP